jgi:hypothetical protein
MYAEDKELAGQCAKLASEARKSVDWINDNAKLVGVDYANRLKTARKALRQIKQCEKAAQRKMCVGIFGPSQTGKSYLISAMARNEEGSLWALFGDEACNFITEINPEGGRESTGLVTRFTIDRTQSLPEGFPVQIKLLSEIDIVKIITNTFYADAEHSDEPDRDAIVKSLKDLEGHKQALKQVAFDESSVEDLQEYITNNFRSKPRVQCLSRCFWDTAVQIAPYLDLQDRAALFALIWDNLPEFTGLYQRLASALSDLNHPIEAYCSKNALMPREKSIIDVITLNSLISGEEELLDIQADNGKRTGLPRGIIAALTAELTIIIQDKPAPFFDHTDLLDFPGYRSREKVTQLPAIVKVGNNLAEFFLRGKVAYLFERYCAEKELTSLLLCIGPSTQEVKDLPIAVNNWVNTTHGSTPELRSANLCALFFVFTKCDMEFDRKSGSPDVSKRWDIRIENGLIKQFGMTSERNWPEEWDSSGPFSNAFLLRNPEYRFTAVLDFENDKEVSIRKDAVDFVEELKKSFLSSTVARRHFSDPAKAWNALMMMNDGGISYIRAALDPLCRPELKRKQIRGSLKEILETLTAGLKPYWYNDDKATQRQEKKVLGLTLAKTVMAMAKKSNFGQFLRLLMLRDQDVYDLYFDKQYQIQEELSAAGAASESGGAAATVDVESDMFDLFGDDASLIIDASRSDPQGGKETPSGPKNEIEAFRTLIEQRWLNQLHEIENDQAKLRHLGMPAQMFSRFVEELHCGMIRLGLRPEIDEALKNAGSYVNMEKERIIWKQARLTASIINRYVDWLGFDPDRCDESRRVINVSDKDRVVFQPLQAFKGLPHLEETPTQFDESYYKDWTFAMVNLIRENVSFDGVQKVDFEQNARLKNILDALHL